MVKVRVENLITHESDVFDMSRVPCVGELVYVVGGDGEALEVKAVFHAMNANPETQHVALIRVR